MARYSYHGPAHVLIVGKNTYRRAPAATVEVEISKEAAIALGPEHQFYDGETLVGTPPSFVDQRGDIVEQVAPTPVPAQSAPAKS